MAGLVAARDWSSTPIGPIAGWPQSLRSVVQMVLASRFPMWMAWGPELTFLYNDAYRQATLGPKHPWALGRSAREVWSEIWGDIGPRIETVLTTGEATWDEALLLFLERFDYPEETYHTFSYSPLMDNASRIAGMLCVVAEETTRVIGERRLATLRELAAALSAVHTEAGVLEAVQQSLARNNRDLPFTLTYLCDPEGDTADLVCQTGFPGTHPGAPPTVALQGPGSVWPLRRVPPTAIIDDLADRVPVPLPSGAWAAAPGTAMIVALRQRGQDRPAGFLVAGLNPHRPRDADEAAFVELVAGQIGAGIANARAYEAERRRAMALAELDRAKTEFFSNVSHEFRTPLTLILGPVEDALMAGQSGQHTEMLDAVHRNALRLSRLVDTVLDFSRLEAGRMQVERRPVDLASFTADLAAQFRSAVERGGVALIVEVPDEAVVASVDPDLWERIVLNLISNAFKFTFEGAITVRLAIDDGDAVLTVADTGIGIPSSELPHLFDRFHRVRGARSRTQEGTGIGLALTRELVNVHEGTITVGSTPGTGTIFTVRVPTSAPGQAGGGETPRKVTSRLAEPFVGEALRWLPGTTATPGLSRDAGAPPATRVSGSPPARVVVVDDNADLRDYLTRVLGAMWTVEAYGDGQVAADAIRRSPPDLVVSDVMMPGLDGFGLLRAVREWPETQRIPVILLSARAGEEAAVEGLAEGADDYLAKPFSSRELVARVKAHLDLATLRESAARAAELQARRLTRLADAATRMSRCPTVDECLRYATDTARDLVGATEATARLVPEEPLGGHLGGHPAGDTIEPPAPPASEDGLTVPMLGSAGHPLGFIHLADKETGAFEVEDQAILIQLAQLAAGRIESLRTLEREQQVAATLQNSLLPDRLPEVDGVLLASRYVAISNEAVIGGDWYDAFALADGSLALAIGDVVGHGVRAAATMGQLRNALRAFLFQGHGPAHALGLLNRLVANLGTEAFATAVVAIFDPGTRTLRHASAGHPPLLVVAAGGEVRWLDEVHSIALGITPTASYRDSTITLEGGATVLAYTDGLVERRGQDLGARMGRLAAYCSSVAGDPSLIIEAVLAGLGDGERTDDIAMLAVMPEPSPAEGLTLRVPSAPVLLRRVRQRLRSWLLPLHLPEIEGWDLVLAADELTANAMEHPGLGADATVLLGVRLEGDDAVITVGDRGSWHEGGSREDRGRGLPIVDAVTDARTLRHDASGSTVTVRKRIHPHAPG
jgi:signal transduction histidine kinase/serine phosphatase RsbU (regulator of sigma subunit)/FixJ family two-component response regulator